MRLHILGCSGGISPGHGTTSFLVDESLLIDAGTGVESLEHARLAKVKSIVLTHSHLDHISHLPFLLNNLIGEVDFTINVYGIAPTIQALKDHIFNNIIWPDFTRIPSVEAPCVRLHVIEVGQTLVFEETNAKGQLLRKEVTVLPVEHSVPAVGYHVKNAYGSFAFSGDCSRNDVFWAALNQLPEVDVLIMDDQYLASESRVSELAKHYYSATLKADLCKLYYVPKLYLTHLPPYKKQTVLWEAQAVLADWKPDVLSPGLVIDFAE